MASPKKRGEGTSCHHCKKRIRPNEMLKCTRGEVVPTNSRKRKRPCVKKYCLHCIKTFYSIQYLDDNSNGAFICPACNDECRCAACRRRVMKARLKNDGSSLSNEADTQTHSILESQTPDATNIEEGQVNGLLEILDSRPDVQDIIRRGMAMDFADDNAKILYVGHLIDQALTRPDVLALYYASSHGRSGTCRIKTEKTNGANPNNGQSKRKSKSSSPNPRKRKKPGPKPTSKSTSKSNSKAGSKAVSKRKKRASPPQNNQDPESQNQKEWSPESLPKIDDLPPQTVKQEVQDSMTLLPQQAMNSIMPNMNSMPSHLNSMAVNGFGIAPTPATMSLSGGNMNFVNFGPNMTNMTNIPNMAPMGMVAQFPPQQHGQNGQNGNIIHSQPIPMAPQASSSVTTEDVQEPFPMNVTPSVMAGGPPLASM